MDLEKYSKLIVEFQFF